MLSLSPEDKAACEATEIRNAQILDRVLEGVHSEDPEEHGNTLRYVLALKTEDLMVHVPKLADQDHRAALLDVSFYEALTLQLMLRLGILLAGDSDAPWHERGFDDLNEGLDWLQKTALTRALDATQPELKRWLSVRIAESVENYQVPASALVGWRVVPQAPLDPGPVIDLVCTHHLHLMGMRGLLFYDDEELRMMPKFRELVDRYLRLLRETPQPAQA